MRAIIISTVIAVTALAISIYLWRENRLSSIEVASARREVREINTKIASLAERLDRLQDEKRKFEEATSTRFAKLNELDQKLAAESGKIEKLSKNLSLLAHASNEAFAAAAAQIREVRDGINNVLEAVKSPSKRSEPTAIDPPASATPPAPLAHP